MPQIKWVKKLINAKNWKEWYGDNSAYCLLTKDKNGIWAGFSLAQDDDRDHKECFDLTLEELRFVDDYRKGNNIAPRPFEDVESEGQKQTRMNLGIKIDEIREVFNIH